MVDVAREGTVDHAVDARQPGDRDSARDTFDICLGNNASGVALQIFRDDGTASWTTAPLNGTPPRTRDQPALAYHDGYVYAFFGGVAANLDSPDRFDVNAMVWQAIPADPAFGGGGTYNGRSVSPIAILGDHLVTFGGGTNAGFWADSAVHILDAGTLAWGSTISSAAVTPVIGNALVSSQERIVAYSGEVDNPASNCDSQQTLLIDPASGTIVPTAVPPLPMQPLHAPWSADLGRAVMVWGGYHLPCDSNVANIEYYAGGSLGVVDTSRGTISWIALPADTFQPVAQSSVGAAYYQGSMQAMWTGREAIVWGGSETAGNDPQQTVNGSRYQPPVGCVCPSAQLVCSTVSQINSTACDPTGQ